MAENKDIELRIRARDYSQKTLAQVVDSLQELADAQKAQVDAAKKGEVSAKALESSYRQIEQAAQALAKQGALIKTFETQNRVFESTKEAVDKARRAQEDYAKSLPVAGERTKQQAKDLQTYAKAVERAEAAQRRASDRLDNTSSKLREYGIETESVSVAQNKIVDSISLANRALEVQDKAINTLEGDLRSYNEVLKAQAADEQRVADIKRKIAQDEARRIELGERWALTLNRIQKAQYEANQAERAAAIRAEANEFEKLTAVQAQSRKELEARAKAEKDAIESDYRMLEAANKQRQALRLLGDQLAGTAKGYQTLARATSTLSGDFSLANQIRGITDPAAKAISSINGLENSLTTLENRVRAINGPVKQYQETLKSLEAAQRSAAAIAGQIDGYRRQIEVLKAAREEFAKARGDVNQLTQALHSGQGGDDLTARMAQAQTNLRKASEEMARQIGKARELQAGLKAAGVSTSNLAKEEERLVGVAQRSTATLNSLTDALKKNGRASDDAGNAISRFNSGARESLSYYQRLRGEVIALGTAYVGVFGAIGLAQKSLDAAQTRGSFFRAASEVFNGDTTKVQQEWEYLGKAAQTIGFDFEAATKAYQKFLIAANAGGFTLQETRYIFENIAKGAVNAGLSADEFAGAMKAVEQIMSKGRVQAEELTGQLGDRLPGVIAKYARSLNIEIPELIKRMEAGAISARTLLNFAQELERSGAGVIETAETKLQKTTAAFNKAKFDFQLALADSGFTQAYTEFLVKLTTLLNSPEGKKAAQGLGDLFSGIVKALGWMAENLDLVKTALFAIVAGKATVFFVSLAATLGTATTALAGLLAGWRTFSTTLAATGATVATTTGLVTGLGGALKILTRAIPFVGWALVIYEVGDAFFDLSGKISQATDKIMQFAREGAKALNKEGGAQGNAALAQTTVGKVIAGTLDALGIDRGAAKPGNTIITGKLPKPSASGGTTGLTPNPGTQVTPSDVAAKEQEEFLKKNAEKLKKSTDEAQSRLAKDNLAERQKIATRELTERRKQIEQTVTDEKKRGALLIEIDKQIAEVRLNEQREYQAQHRAGVEAGANREVKLAQEIALQMGKIEDELAAKSAQIDPSAPFEERLQKRLAAIAHEYDKLKIKIAEFAKFRPEEAARLGGTLDTFVQQRQNLEEIKAKQEELTALEKKLADQQGLRSAELERINALYEAGKMSVDEMRFAVAEANSQMAGGINTAADAVEVFATRIRGLLEPGQYEALIAKLATVRAQNNPDRTNAADAVKQQEGDLNRLLQQRQIILDEIQRKKELGILTDEEATRRINETNGLFKTSIVEATSLLDSYIQTLMTMTTDPAALMQLEAMLAKIRAIRDETENTKRVYSEFAQTVISSAAEGITQTLNQFVDIFGEVVTGQKSAAQGFKDMAKAGLQMFAQLLREAAMYIIKLLIIRALESNPTTAPVGAAMRVSSGITAKHTGGMAGAPSGMSRSVSPGIFATAQRLHNGGIPGLTNNEVPAVLLKNEEVLTRSDPRHVMNGGKSSAGGSQRFVLVDDRAKVAEAMTSADGEQVTLLHLRNNVATIKQLLR